MLFAEISPQILFLAGAVVIAMAILRRSTRNLKQTQQNLARGSALSSAAQHDSTDSQSRWEVQMYDLSRDLVGQLDSKIAIVRELSRQAEQITARLELAVEVARHEKVLPLDSSLAEDHRERLARQTLLAQQPEACRLFDAGQSPSTIAERLGCKVGDVELLLSLRTKAS
jgi:hypothetical protein